MKKVIKSIFAIVICAAVGIGVYRFWPYISAHLFSNASAKWINQIISERINEQSELLVLDIEQSGVETVTKEGWLIGTVQRVEIPYQFTMHYSVDLSKAHVETEGTNVRVYIPAPQPGYQKLTVDEDKMRKVDWLYPLTPEAYSEIKLDIENKLYDQYATSSECADKAWETAVKDLGGLLDEAMQSQYSNGLNPYTILIVKDNNPADEPAA